LKDVDFDATAASYENLKSVKNRIKNMPSTIALKDVTDFNFDGLKQDFERVKSYADKLTDVKTDKNMPESLENVDFNELKQEFTDMEGLAKDLREMDPSKLPQQF
jgi:hypothetical protein